MGGIPTKLTAVALLIISLVFTITISATIGTVDIPIQHVFLIIINELTHKTQSLINTGSNPYPIYEGASTHRTIILQIRLPRILVASIVGFALGAAGAVMQGFFRNPMADPQIIGVSSGAAVGAVAMITLTTNYLLGITGAAFIGALIAAFTVYLLATKNGRTGVATLLLAGIAVQMFLGALISLMFYLADDESLREAVYWMMGNLIHRDWWHVYYSLPIVLIGVGVLMTYSDELNILALGEEDAHTIGVEVEHTKRVLLAVSSIITAAAVAVSGVIGFVGLIVPHGVRLVTGPDHRTLIPYSALSGSIFLVLADNLARSILGSSELPVGIVTALIGVPFFLYLLRKREAYEL